jgi:SAM-dependent methyltransferase
MLASFFSRKGTAALMGKYYDRFMSGIEEKVLIRRRKQLFSGLQGKILEIGTGTGINLDLFPKKTTVVGFEPNPFMLSHAYERAAFIENPNRFALYNLKTEDGTDILNEAAPFDALVFTLVLCTVAQPESLVRSLLPYLREGAPILVLEHIIDPHPLIRWIQKTINPVWKRCAEGCHLTRSTDQMLEQIGLKATNASYFRAGLTFYQAVLYQT